MSNPNFFQDNVFCDDNRSAIPPLINGLNFFVQNITNNFVADNHTPPNNFDERGMHRSYRGFGGNRYFAPNQRYHPYNTNANRRDYNIRNPNLEPSQYQHQTYKVTELSNDDRNYNRQRYNNKQPRHRRFFAADDVYVPTRPLAYNFFLNRTEQYILRQLEDTSKRFDQSIQSTNVDFTSDVQSISNDAILSNETGDLERETLSKNSLVSNSLLVEVSAEAKNPDELVQSEVDTEISHHSVNKEVQFEGENIELEIVDDVIQVPLTGNSLSPSNQFQKSSENSLEVIEITQPIDMSENCRNTDTSMSTSTSPAKTRHHKRNNVIDVVNDNSSEESEDNGERSDTDSVILVPRTPPPVIELDSDDENISPSKTVMNKSNMYKEVNTVTVCNQSVFGSTTIHNTCISTSVKNEIYSSGDVRNAIVNSTITQVSTDSTANYLLNSEITNVNVQQISSTQQYGVAIIHPEVVSESTTQNPQSTEIVELSDSNDSIDVVGDEDKDSDIDVGETELQQKNNDNNTNRKRRNSHNFTAPKTPKRQDTVPKAPSTPDSRCSDDYGSYNTHAYDSVGEFNFSLHEDASLKVLQDVPVAKNASASAIIAYESESSQSEVHVDIGKSSKQIDLNLSNNLNFSKTAFSEINLVQLSDVIDENIIRKTKKNTSIGTDSNLSRTCVSFSGGPTSTVLTNPSNFVQDDTSDTEKDSSREVVKKSNKKSASKNDEQERIKLKKDKSKANGSESSSKRKNKNVKLNVEDSDDSNEKISRKKKRDNKIEKQRKSKSDERSTSSDEDNVEESVNLNKKKKKKKTDGITTEDNENRKRKKNKNEIVDNENDNNGSQSAVAESVKLKKKKKNKRDNDLKTKEQSETPRKKSDRTSENYSDESNQSQDESNLSKCSGKLIKKNKHLSRKNNEEIVNRSISDSINESLTTKMKKKKKKKEEKMLDQQRVEKMTKSQDSHDDTSESDKQSEPKRKKKEDSTSKSIKKRSKSEESSKSESSEKSTNKTTNKQKTVFENVSDKINNLDAYKFKTNRERIAFKQIVRKFRKNKKIRKKFTKSELFDKAYRKIKELRKIKKMKDKQKQINEKIEEELSQITKRKKSEESEEESEVPSTKTKKIKVDISEISNCITINSDDDSDCVITEEPQAPVEILSEEDTLQLNISEFMENHDEKNLPNEQCELEEKQPDLNESLNMSSEFISLEKIATSTPGKQLSKEANISQESSHSKFAQNIERMHVSSQTLNKTVPDFNLTLNETGIPFTMDMKSFYNKSWGGETFDHQIIRKQMPRVQSEWGILNADRPGYTKKDRARCKKCREVGHNAMQCKRPKPACKMCGSKKHSVFKCTQAACMTCFTKQPPGRFTNDCRNCFKWIQLCCQICYLRGHPTSQCPDLWRRYHLTINPGKLNEPPSQHPSFVPWCSWCARRGHAAEECFKVPKNQLSLPTVRVSEYTSNLENRSSESEAESSRKTENARVNQEMAWSIHNLQFDQDAGYLTEVKNGETLRYSLSSTGASHLERSINRSNYQTPQVRPYIGGDSSEQLKRKLIDDNIKTKGSKPQLIDDNVQTKGLKRKLIDDTSDLEWKNPRVEGSGKIFSGETNATIVSRKEVDHLPNEPVNQTILSDRIIRTDGDSFNIIISETNRSNVLTPNSTEKLCEAQESDNIIVTNNQNDNKENPKTNCSSVIPDDWKQSLKEDFIPFNTEPQKKIKIIITHADKTILTNHPDYLRFLETEFNVAILLTASYTYSEIHIDAPANILQENAEKIQASLKQFLFEKHRNSVTYEQIANGFRLFESVKKIKIERFFNDLMRLDKIVKKDRAKHRTTPVEATKEFKAKKLRFCIYVSLVTDWLPEMVDFGNRLNEYYCTAPKGSVTSDPFVVEAFKNVFTDENYERFVSLFLNRRHRKC